MIRRSLIRPGLIGLRTKIIIGLPAVIPLRFSMITAIYMLVYSTVLVVSPGPANIYTNFETWQVIVLHVQGSKTPF